MARVQLLTLVFVAIAASDVFQRGMHWPTLLTSLSLSATVSAIFQSSASAFQSSCPGNRQPPCGPRCSCCLPRQMPTVSGIGLALTSHLTLGQVVSYCYDGCSLQSASSIGAPEQVYCPPPRLVRPIKATKTFQVFKLSHEYQYGTMCSSFAASQKMAARLLLQGLGQQLLRV